MGLDYTIGGLCLQLDYKQFSEADTGEEIQFFCLKFPSTHN